MPELRLDECAFCGTPTWCKKRGDGRPQCRACEVERFFDEVLYRPIGFRLLDWQRRSLRRVYGTVDPNTGRRLVRRAYRRVAKKNGKSFKLGGIPHFHMLMEAEEFKQEIYGCAAAKDQAGIIFNSAASLVSKNTILQRRLEVIPSKKRISRRDGGGFYQVISADGDLQDGVEPSVALIDELHRWKTAKALTLWNVITKGTISRMEPLVWEITTAGSVHESLKCLDEDNYARRVIAGEIIDPRFDAEIYEADIERLKTDPEYWKSREARVAANPSHEDLGGFLRDEEIAAVMREAVEKPHERNDYLRYHLDIWTSAANRYLPIDAWNACGVPLRTLIGRECIAGLDLSHTTDLTALVLLFPCEDDTFDVLPFFFMPEGQIEKRQKADKQPYRSWVDQGFITATEGDSVDYDAVIEKILWCRDTFQLRHVQADPSGYQYIHNRMESEGIQDLAQRQGFAKSAAITHLLDLVNQKRIRHANHPILNWNADCATARTNDDQAVKLVKPNRPTDNVRIDGIDALTNAIAYQLLMAPQSSGPVEVEVSL